MSWGNVYITDKTGRKMFNTVASPMSIMSEVKNLTRHIENARKYPAQYKFMDIASAQVMLDGEPYGAQNSMSDDELLAALGV